MQFTFVTIMGNLDQNPPFPWRHTHTLLDPPSSSSVVSSVATKENTLESSLTWGACPPVRAQYCHYLLFLPSLAQTRAAGALI